MEQSTLCYLSLNLSQMKRLLEAIYSFQQNCTIVILVNIGLLVFLALYVRFLFDLIARPNIHVNKLDSKLEATPRVTAGLLIFGLSYSQGYIIQNSKNTY